MNKGLYCISWIKLEMDPNNLLNKVIQAYNVHTPAKSRPFDVSTCHIVEITHSNHLGKK
jgi:hypothetical protein